MHCWCSSRLAGRDPPRLDSSTSGTGGGGAERVPERADRRLLCVPVPNAWLLSGEPLELARSQPCGTCIQRG